ncbi:Rhomboid-related protein 3, partial [Stegodyphus mimosarum]
MSGKRTRSFKIAVQHRDREELLRERDRALFHSMVAKIAHHFLADDRDRKYYADRYTCCPPPLFVLLVTLVELGFFTYYTVSTGVVTTTGPVPIDSPFIYRPDK